MPLYCMCAGDFDLTFADKVSTLKDHWNIAKCSNEVRFNTDLTSASVSLPLSVKSFSEQITVFRNIASHYNMGFLEEMIDWLGAMSPNIKPNSHWVSAASMESTKTWGKLARHWDKKWECTIIFTFMLSCTVCEFYIFAVNKDFYRWSSPMCFVTTHAELLC